MPSRRSLLSYAALTGGLLAVNRASARSATRELVGIDGWLNTDGPLTMAELRGKVVLVEFCTYTCINWRRTLPYVHRWHSEYGPQGLQIIGVHTPEFGFEREPSKCRERHPRAGRTLPHRPGQRVPNLGRMGQSRLAVVLRSGPGWTGSPGSRRRGIRPGDRGRHSQPARSCARRLERTSRGRCRPVPRLVHPRSISGPRIPHGRTAHSRLGKARQPTPSPSPAVPD